MVTPSSSVAGSFGNGMVWTSFLCPAMVRTRREVVFVTVDGCLFNGLYLHEEQVFHGYDSLDFKPDEILAWSTCQFYVQIKDRYYFPDGSEWTTDDGDC